MLRLKDTLGGEPITFNYCETYADKTEMIRFAARHSALGMDTESTGINPYRPGWELRTFQIGNRNTAYVLPAKYKGIIYNIITGPTKWIGHNGSHDIRSIDVWLNEPTGVRCAGETYIPAHHHDSRKQEDGGIGYSLKAQAERYVAGDSGKWEDALKKVFKTIEVPIPGEVYKAGPRKGTPKFRKARLDEGWHLIDPTHPAYVAYAAADPILTYRLWAHYQPTIREHRALYHFDLQIQHIADTLNRRAMLLDEGYTRALDAAYLEQAERHQQRAAEMGVANINSGAQIAAALLALGARLKAKTPTGKYKTDDKILRGLVSIYGGEYSPVKELIHSILAAKQMLKRRSSYTQQMLAEMDEHGRVHPSINTLGARTSRMSVSNPPLQQLPTKDREKDAAMEVAV